MKSLFLNKTIQFLSKYQNYSEEEVEKLKYKGKVTDTASVYVDNRNGTISVDVSGVYSKEEVNKKLEELYDKISEESEENIDIINKKFDTLEKDIDTKLLQMSEKLEEQIEAKFSNIKPKVISGDELLDFDFNVEG